MARPTRLTAEMIQQYVEQGLWSTTTTVDLVDEYALARSEREAVVDATRRLTWTQVKELTDRLAIAFLDTGLQRDAAVVVQLPNGVESFLVRLALKKAGLLGVYVPFVWRRAELESVLARLEAAAVIVPEGFRGFSFEEMIREIQIGKPYLRHVFVLGKKVLRIGAVETPDQLLAMAAPDQKRIGAARYRAHEVSLIAVSSGSTGAPKLCEWPEAAQVLAAKGIAQRLRLTAEDVAGIFAPLGGGAGSMTWLAALAAGSKTVVAESFKPEELLALIGRERVTFAGTVPAILIRILECPELYRFDLSSLRVIRTGTAALPPAVAREAERRLGCKIVPAAGSMETITFAQTAIDDSQEIRLGGYVGRVLPGGEAKIVDEGGGEVARGEVGEMWIRGAYTGSGYFRDLEATVGAWGELGPNGWFRTGDLARMDAHGNLMLVGRKREVIVRGGYKIYPGELETLLIQHPAVSEASVAALPDPVLGQRICVFVIPKEEQQVTLLELKEFLARKEIAAYKLPEHLVLLDEFPRLENDKVDKRKLVRRIVEIQQAREGR